MTQRQEKINKLEEKIQKRVSKINVWLKHFLNQKSTVTFLSKEQSARAAKYKCCSPESFRNVGSQNYRKCADKISKWLDENGLSENALKIKLLSLMEAKETKFFSAPTKDEDGNVSDIFVKEVEIEAIETQRKTLDMALKVKGMHAPTKHELTGKDGKPLAPPREMKIVVKYCKPKKAIVQTDTNRTKEVRESA